MLQSANAQGRAPELWNDVATAAELTCVAFQNAWNLEYQNLASWKLYQDIPESVFGDYHESSARCLHLYTSFLILVIRVSYHMMDFVD